MRYLIAIILILVSASRAEIPLELIAEFQVPSETMGRIDIQHWMDDSTFGWVAIANNELIYETRLGEGVQVLSFGDTLCDESGGGGHPYVLKRACIVKGNNEEVRVAVACEVAPWINSGLTTLMLLDPLSGNDTCFHFSNDRLWVGYPGLHAIKCTAWPPTPELTQKIVLSLWYEVCRDLGNFYCHLRSRTLVLNVASREFELDVENMIDASPFSGGNEFALGLWGLREYRVDDDISPFDWNTNDTWNFIGSYETGSVAIDTACFHHVDYNPAVGFINHCSTRLGSVVLTSDSTGARRIYAPARIEENGQYFNGIACYDFETRDQIWANVGVTDIFTPLFSACFRPDLGNVVCGGFERLYFLSPNDGRVLDSTEFIDRANFTSILDAGAYRPEFVTQVPGPGGFNTYSIYRISYPPTQLTISSAAIGGQVILRWEPIPGALGYHVCRSLEYSDSLCSTGDVYVTTDTTLVLTPLLGALKEFYRVVPLFE